MSDPTNVDLRPGEDPRKEVLEELEKFRLHTPEEKEALKAKLKDQVGAELGRDGATKESLAAVIEKTVRDEAGAAGGPVIPEEANALKNSTLEMAEKLLLVKQRYGIEKAREIFNTATDRAGPDKNDSPHIPTGTLIGGAAGLGLAMLPDIGDWTSFSGILKKLALITAGIAAGGLIGGDFGINLFAPAKPKSEEKDAAR